MERRQTSEWEAAAFDREQGEWVHTTLRSFETTPDNEDLHELLVTQAPPIKVSPSRRQRGELESVDRVVTVGDIHFPFHHSGRLAVALTGMRALEPTRIDLLGDNLDNANYSRFENRKEWADSTQAGIDQYAEFLGMLRADHPEADIVWHEGNHDQRLEKRVREYNEDLLGIRRSGEKLEALSLEFLLHLGELGVRYSRGYPSAREIVNNQLEIYHGSVTSSSGLAASKVIQQAFLSFNTGHTHNLGVVSKTFYVGNEEHTIYGGESGTFADPNITPSGKYAPNQISRHNWQSGLIKWNVYDDRAVPSIYPITDAGIEINDKVYKS